MKQSKTGILIIRGIGNIFEQGKDYYKLVRVDNFWSRNYIEYESNSDRKNTLSIEEYFTKIRPYLENIIND